MKKKPRLVLVTKYQFPWMGVPFLYNVPPRMANDYDIIILSGGTESKKWKGITVSGLGKIYNLPFIRELLISFKICSWLLNYFETIDYLYVYNDTFLGIFCGATIKILKALRKVKLRSYYHMESKWFSKINELIIPFFRYMLNYVYDKIFVFDDLLEKYLIEKGIDKEKIKIISTGVNTDYFKYEPNNQNIPIAVYVGTLHKRRRLDILLLAFKKVVSYIPTAELYVVGDGPDKNRLLILSNHLNIGKNVIFTGIVEHSEVARYINISTICLASYPPKEYDIQFPYKILEYQACKKPVITTKTSSTLKYLHDSKDAILTDFDETKLAYSMLLLFRDKELRDELSENGYNECKKFNWDKVVSKIIQVMIEL